MSVQELKTVIAQLPLSDLTDFAHWFEEFQQDAKDHKSESGSNTSDQKIRTAGLHAGYVWISEAFDDPLSDDFWNRTP